MVGPFFISKMCMKKIVLSLVIVAGIINLVSGQTIPTVPSNVVDSSKFKTVVTPKGFTTQLNVVYTRVNDWDGRMDLYLPPAQGAPTPVIINIHGGGWNHGAKEEQGGFTPYFKAGFAVANIEYRLTSQATAPAAIEDTRCALIYLIKNAKELHLDPNKIIIMGGSAGGHLALMGGLLQNNHLFDSNCSGVENVKVAAIIDKYGIADVNDWAYGPYIKSKSATNWLGAKKDDQEFIKSVSPIHWVKKTSPPVFIVHGDADPTVPYQESVALHEALVKAGVKTEFITIPGGLHGKFDKDQNNMLNDAIFKFINELEVFKK
jgi:acetyl esterase/lipase